jgi:hypothetical protein
MNLETFFRVLQEVRSQCGGHVRTFGEKYSVDTTVPPVGAFHMCFNHATVAVELTSHYAREWSAIDWAKRHRPEDIDRAKDNNTERLIFLSKTMFVWSMSSIEYVANEVARAHPSMFLGKKNPKGLTFSDIIKRSTAAGLIDATKEPSWVAANMLRNIAVHNNGVATASGSWKITDEVTIVAEQGKMIKGSIMTFPYLTRWLIEEIAVWTDRFLTRTA